MAEESRPPTPPSRAPDREERRFKVLTSACEGIEDYHPGGFHPVHLGNLFKEDQYKVIRKLGNGSFSTVWLARDQKNNRYVALKILVSEIPETTNELQILRHVAEVAPLEGSRYITQLLDEFKHHGPNGVHTCLVFEPMGMGPSVNSMVFELPQFKPIKRLMKIRYPPSRAREILKQSLQALAFLHKKGIAHGDFQPGNMLFVLDEIDSEPEARLRQEKNEETEFISPPVQRCQKCGTLDSMNLMGLQLSDCLACLSSLALPESTFL